VPLHAEEPNGLKVDAIEKAKRYIRIMKSYNSAYGIDNYRNTSTVVPPTNEYMSHICRRASIRDGMMETVSIIPFVDAHFDLVVARKRSPRRQFPERVPRRRHDATHGALAPPPAPL
jgi:hypothetical protein